MLPVLPGRGSHRGGMSMMSREMVAALAVVVFSVLLICYASPAAAQDPGAVTVDEERRSPPGATQSAGRPEPQYAAWRPPALDDYTSVLKKGERAPIDPEKRYDLLELIDLAQRTNPETRVAWEAARQAAIGIGLVQSEYFPVLALAALGGYKSVGLPAPKNVAPNGFFRVDLEQAVPILNLRWLLLDFGRRGNALDAAKERLLSANLAFNRKHQEIIFRVQRAFLVLTSLERKIVVAQSSLDTARAVRRSAEAQLRTGLATLPGGLPRQATGGPGRLDLEDALARERDAQVTLAESIGITPTTAIQVIDFSALPPPAALEDSVDKVIERALETRPDLIAKVAVVRAKEAECVERGRPISRRYPSSVILVDPGPGENHRRESGQRDRMVRCRRASYGVELNLEWNLFEGGARLRRVELAEAERRAAEDEVTAARDRAISEVWKAYTDVHLAGRRLDVAAALVTASEQSYESILESYRHGLGTLIDLLAARRELSRARFVEVDTKLQLLNSSAVLAFTTGDSPQGQSRAR